MGDASSLLTDVARKLACSLLGLFLSVSLPSCQQISGLNSPNLSFPEGAMHAQATAPGKNFSAYMKAFGVPALQFGRPALAAGLVQLPSSRLNNQYYLVRAGESEWESFGVVNTNPVAKTNVQSGLSEEGKRQSISAAREIRSLGACEASCWIWPSINMRAYQTAEIIGYVNGIDYSRIVPEYSFLDARGLGAFEGRPLESMHEVYDLDSQSPYLRPPPTTDGTPNESAADVLVRVIQLMSVLETQFSKDTIVIVSPDSDNLSVLQSAMLGLDLSSHSKLAFAPGEVRRVDLEGVSVPEPLSGVLPYTRPTR